jgi:hypothetical protein
MHQCPGYGKGHNIHSTAQIWAYGGQQRLITSEGYHITLSYQYCLPYMDMHPPTDDELQQLPHIILTSDAVWDPSSLDDELSFSK